MLHCTQERPAARCLSQAKELARSCPGALTARWSVQLLLLVCFVVFLLCLPVRLVLSLCCGVKLQPPGPAQTPGAANEDDFDEHDRDVVINMPEETITPEEVLHINSYLVPCPIMYVAPSS